MSQSDIGLPSAVGAQQAQHRAGRHLQVHACQRGGAAVARWQARQREIFHRHEQSLAREIAATTGATPSAPEPRLIAAGVLGAIRTLQESGNDELAAGQALPSPGTLRSELDRMFDLLARGLGEYGR